MKKFFISQSKPTRRLLCESEEKQNEREMILNTKHKNRRKRYVACDELAEWVGFEPTVPLPVHLISSQGRYNHFDTTPHSYDIITNTKQKIKPGFFVFSIYKLEVNLYTTIDKVARWVYYIYKK